MVKYILLFIGVFLLLFFAIIYRKELIDIDKIYRFFVSNYQVPLDQRPWFKNSYCNVSVETPYKLKVIDTKIPNEQEDIKSLKNYTAGEGGYFVALFCLETTFTSYNVKEGLEETISHLIDSRNGSNLQLKFQETDNQFTDITCTGTAELTNGIGAIQGYAHWDGKGRIVAVVGVGENNRYSKKVLQKIIKGIKINP